MTARLTILAVLVATALLGHAATTTLGAVLAALVLWLFLVVLAWIERGSSSAERVASSPVGD